MLQSIDLLSLCISQFSSVPAETRNATCHCLCYRILHYILSEFLDLTVQWHVVGGTCVTRCGAVCMVCCIMAYLFENIRACSSGWESVTPSYAKQREVLEHVSQHATLAFPQPNCATHLSKVSQQPEPAMFKNPLCRMLREKNGIRESWGGKPKRWGRRKIQESRKPSETRKKNTYSGQDIWCCYGYLFHTSTSSSRSKHCLMSDKYNALM